MITDKLITPCGTISVLRNNHPISFDVTDSPYNSMWLKDDTTGKETAVHPDRCVEITIDTQKFMIGDRIVCSLDKDIVSSDGGGERLLNTTGQYNGFDIALGAPDSDDYEYS